jgi:diguanylate cyclase (GGDEF)-like protein
LISEMLRTTWRSGLVITHAERVEDANQQLLGGSVTAILLGGPDQSAMLEHVRLIAPGIPVIVLAKEYTADDAVLALRAGAQDVLSKAHLTASALALALTHAIERKRSEVQLATRALQDPLTGLPNRTLFLDRLGVALDRARRTGLVTGVLFLDVDQFKTINDSLGHAAGDRVLTALAGRLRAVLRPMDTVARFGGDEFTFLFEDLSDESEALAIAERVREAASVPIGLDGVQRPLTVSIGVATASGPGISPDSLVRDADAAMYRAKRRGGGEAAVADEELGFAGPPADRLEQRAQLANQLRDAVDRSELLVYYQPRYGLNNGEHVSGFEALVRWQHPERGLIPPAEFIPLAEEMGLASSIGQFVLHQALPLLARLRRQHADLTVSINLSSDQLADPELAAALAAVGASGVQPAALVVDIRESTVSQDPEGAIRAAGVLRAAGIRVAIDDYGTGSAPLHSLRRLQADELKIHQSFVGELNSGGGDTAIVGAVVELGHALGMTVVAEGVETDEQLLELRELGCDGAQGYLLCRPIAAEQLEELLTHAG